MFILISYDVANDRRRTKIAKALEGNGTRVQYSVFECELSAKQFTELKTKLLKFLQPRGKAIPPTDSIRCYRLCEGCLEQAEIFGSGELARDKMYYLV